MTPSNVLVANAFSQFTVAALVGFAMLLPRQPWFRFKLPLRQKELLAAHLDWIMLGLVQIAGAVAMQSHTTPSWPVTWLLVFGGWVNALPYLLRGMGIDAFVLAGSPAQRIGAAISGISSMALLVAFALMTFSLWG